MLRLMNSVERISQIIPQFKLQLVFLEEREKLFRSIDNNRVQYDGSSSVANTTCETPPVVSKLSDSLSTALARSSTSLSSTLGSTNLINNLSQKSSANDTVSDTSGADENSPVAFPDVYKIPMLSNALLKDIQNGLHDTFGPHCSNRQVLIDAVSFDLLENYGLFYPTKKQFNDIGLAIVKFLKLPSTNENINIWKQAVQTKLKRKRSENPNNPEVQQFRSTYSRSGSGRPVKRKLDQVAERCRHKQILLLPHNDDNSSDVQAKAKQLKDLTQLDLNTQLNLWKETFYLRRRSIRDRSTRDILQDFPGYSNSFLVFEEVKLLVELDLSSEIRRQVPLLLDKILEVPVFITDSPPIRLLKVLCKQFDETLQHILCDKEPCTPYPSLVCIDDMIYVYVDFHCITSTSSPDDALGLLIAMYTIFELSFDKKSRVTRLIYSVLHGDKQYLSNSIRMYIKEKNIDISSQKIKLPSVVPSVLSNDNTNVTDNTQSQAQIDIIPFNNQTSEDSSLINSQTTQSTLTRVNPNTHSDSCIENNHDTNNLDNASPSTTTTLKSQSRTKGKRKRKQTLMDNEEDDSIEKDSLQHDGRCIGANHLPLKDIVNIESTTRRTRRKPTS